jgi:hypothetical protein
VIYQTLRTPPRLSVTHRNSGRTLIPSLWLPIRAHAAAKRVFACYGTEGSNLSPSSGESANFRSLSRSEIAELNFRIHSPPADSPSLAGIHLAFWRSRDFPRVSGPRVGGLVDRDAQDALIYAATAKYLCRAKFQYRSAADAGRDGSGTAAERGRVASGVGDRSRSFEFGAAQAKPSAARCSRLSVRSCPGAVRPLAATNIQFWQGGLEISKTTRVFRSNQHRVVPVADYK